MINLKTAYTSHIIDNDMLWIQFIENRNHTSHIYSENMSEQIAERIKTQYVTATGKMIENIEKTLN